MKGIILKDFEVRRLASAGSVLIWRRVNFAYKPEGDEQFIRMQPGFPDGSTRAIFEGFCSEYPFSVKCPHGSTGETRFVKETWMDCDIPNALRGANQIIRGPENKRILGWIHGAWHVDSPDPGGWPIRRGWKSPATMPSWASRFRVTLSVSCRQIQSVTEEEAIDGGCDEAHLEHTEDCESEHCALAGGVDDCCGYLISSRLHLKSLIESRNPGSWNLNSWFWAIEAKEVK